MSKSNGAKQGGKMKKKTKRKPIRKITEEQMEGINGMFAQGYQPDCEMEAHTGISKRRLKRLHGKWEASKDRTLPPQTLEEQVIYLTELVCLLEQACEDWRSIAQALVMTRKEMKDFFNR